MTTTTAGIIFLALLILALAAVHVPLGDYMYRVYSSDKHSRAERIIYRSIGADPKSEQTWGAYARSVLAFSAISILFLFIFQLVQGKLPLHLNDPGTPMTPALAWNTAVSFVTNTNWQAYSGESTMGHLVQMAGLAVQNFVSAAVGMAVAIAVVRGFARRHTGDLGNFWVDLVRGTLRILLPICVVAAIVLIVGGAVQNFHNYDQVVNTLAGGQQTIPGGAVASQEAIKDLGTNGGGFYNVNSAHPFENPTTWTNWVEIFLLLVISFSLPRTFGRMVGSKKQGLAIAAVMATLACHQLERDDVVPTAGPRHGAHRGQRGDGRRRAAVRRRQLRSLRRVDHLDLDRLGRLVPRLLYESRRDGLVVQHAARRGRSRRRGLRFVRHARSRSDHRLRRGPDGRPHTGVSRQEDHTT